VSVQPAVSVLMTAYNREQYVGAAIESVLAQTWSDFELVIVDDASRDRTLAIARAYEARDPRVRVFVNGENLGDYGNRNRAAALARGRYLRYHDSDDLMYPHCLDTMVRALESEPRAGFALSRASAWPGGPCPMLLTPRLAYEREFLGHGLFMCGPSCAMFRAETFRALGGFDDIGVASDYLFWMKACARYPVLLLHADLFWYREHPGQELRSARAARQYAELSGHVWRALHGPECPLEPEALEIARRNHAFATARQIANDLRRGEVGLAVHRLRHARLGVAEWVRYLRPPRRSRLAGTPLAATGEYLVPESMRSPEAERVS